jgi:hypothetical protein
MRGVGQFHFFRRQKPLICCLRSLQLINSIIRLPEPGKRQEPSQLRFERPVDVKEIVVNLEQHDRERVIEGCSWRSLVIARGQRQYSRLGSDLGKEVRKQNFQGVCRKAE